MSDIKDWSDSAGGNTANPPDGWPEGQAPSTVNNCARENMAAIRRWYEDAEWVDWGHTPTQATTTSFTLSGDYSTVYHTGRRIKAYDASILYGTVASVSYTTNTRVSLTLDSGALSASLTSVGVSILSFTNQSIPTGLNANSASSAATLQGLAADQFMQRSTTSTATVKQVFHDIEVSATSTFTSVIVASGGIQTDGSTTIKTTVAEIGAWNMDRETGVSVSHGVGDSTKIRRVTVVVKNDTDAVGFPLIYPLHYDISANSASGDFYIQSTIVSLSRKLNRFFDTADFDQTSTGGGTFNRGWVTIEYEV